MDLTATLKKRIERIQLILSDVDGVLTDGRLHYGSDGGEIKSFHVRDGMAVKLWREAGFRLGLVTARNSEMVSRRAAELNVDFVVQGRSDKLSAVQELVSAEGLTLENVCYVGDDLHDLAAIRNVGLGVTVADGALELQDSASWVTRSAGGEGAIRELVEFLLKAKQCWADIIRPYAGKVSGGG